MDQNSILALTRELDVRMTAAEASLQRSRDILDQIATMLGFRRAPDTGGFPYPGDQRELPDVLTAETVISELSDNLRNHK